MPRRMTSDLPKKPTPRLRRNCQTEKLDGDKLLDGGQSVSGARGMGRARVFQFPSPGAAGGRTEVLGPEVVAKPSQGVLEGVEKGLDRDAPAVQFQGRDWIEAQI